MAAAPPNQEVVIKIIEQSKVSPPPDSVPTTSLPLTFFDFPWLLYSTQMQRLYFYEFPHPTRHFLETLLPNLEHSLSLTLQHFFPFASNLVGPPPPEKPHILFTAGDSVSLTIAESTADTFDFLSASRPRPIRALHPYVPKLAPPTLVDSDRRVGPLMALQVTVFPDSGICIGVRFNHVAADGRAFHHFMKSWALLCKTGGDLALLERELGLPSHDRAAVTDPNGLELDFLDIWRSLESTSSDVDQNAGTARDDLSDNVRATFVLGQAQIESLKRLVTSNNSSKPFHITSFTVTCALIWTCLAKSEEKRENDEGDDEPYFFALPADCRSRVEFPLPATYFGNCLSGCSAQVKRKELLGENGMVAAAEAIGKEVSKLESTALISLEKWMKSYKVDGAEWHRRFISVAGSPRLGVYESDFGWGRPKRSVSVHVEDSSSISLAESRDERGGVEVGLALHRDRMSRFSAILEEVLMKFGLN